MLVCVLRKVKLQDVAVGATFLHNDERWCVQRKQDEGKWVVAKALAPRPKPWHYPLKNFRYGTDVFIV